MIKDAQLHGWLPLVLGYTWLVAQGGRLICPVLLVLGVELLARPKRQVLVSVQLIAVLNMITWGYLSKHQIY